MSRRIRVRHPAYQRNNTLFHIPARDGPNHDSAYYMIVHDACCILTGESGTYLTREDGTQVFADRDGFIRAGVYDVRIPRDDTPDFPITANFRSWVFPHGNLPVHWLEVSKGERQPAPGRSPFSPSAVISETCRITGSHLVPNYSHIIPTSEKQWFTMNEMDEYGVLSGRSGDKVADSSVNRMVLKVDAHKLWDDYNFSIVPKQADNGEWAWFTQMMVEDDEVEEKWHNKKLQSLAGRSPEYLYARFAFHIFPRLLSFLKGGQSRRLTVHMPDGTREAKVYSPAECEKFAEGQGKGRSASPTKRARSQTKDPDTGDVRDRDYENLESQRTIRSSSPSTSVDSALGGIDRCEKYSRRRSVRAPKTSDIPKKVGDDVWAYIYGHGDQERGRKKRRLSIVH